MVYTQSYGGSDRDVSIVKFNETGDFQWYKLWDLDNENEAYGILIDSEDNLFITGKAQFSGSDYDTFLNN
ncbi:MAG: hypothetical protein ACFFAO_22115 [Candidatus Hermodarchaeota archaeon]